MWRPLRRIVVLVVLGILGVVLFAASGLFDMAASRGHLRLTEWFLELGMRRSVAHHSRSLEPPPLDEAMAERAAGHFASGCAPCHGAPGLARHPAAERMLPQPPDLARAVPTWRPRELFYIVRHGLKYTGMPAWPVEGRDDEVWAMVAFLVRLPGMQPAEYRRLTGPPGTAVAGGAPVAALPELAQCARCHGPRGEGSLGVPRLAGQRAEYLRAALEDYASGARPSGIMRPVALFLDGPRREALARHYAALATPSAAAVGAGEAPAERIVREGVPARSIPPCAACHGLDGRAEGNHPRFPALAGQHARYLEQQLRLWRTGTRGGAFGEIMSAAARELTDEEIRALAAYYAGLPARAP